MRARDLYPQYVGPDSPYLMLAKIYRDRGDDEEAAEQLRAYLAVNETDYEARLELATIEQELGDRRGGAAARSRKRSTSTRSTPSSIAAWPSSTKPAATPPEWFARAPLW